MDRFAFLIERTSYAVCVTSKYEVPIDKSAIRVLGLIPVIPLTTINKDTQLPMCIEEQAINY